MSLEEKRATLLDIFHESKEVFLLKVRARSHRPPATRPRPAAARRALNHPPRRLSPTPSSHPQEVEKLGAKRGVVLQAIKDVLQSLVDDDLVRCERIGVSNFFWSFPSEAAVKLESEAARLRARLGMREAEVAALEAQLAKSRAGREDSVRAVEGCWSAVRGRAAPSLTPPSPLPHSAAGRTRGAGGRGRRAWRRGLRETRRGRGQLGERPRALRGAE
jgi:hypothetical protein